MEHNMCPWLWSAEEVVDYFTKIPHTAQIFSAERIQRAFIEHDVTGIVILGDIFNRNLLREEFGITSLDSHTRIFNAVKDLKTAAKELGFDQFRENMEGVVETYLQAGQALPLLRDRLARRISPTPTIASETLHAEPESQVLAPQVEAQEAQWRESDPEFAPLMLSAADYPNAVTYLKVSHPLLSGTGHQIQAMQPPCSPSQLPTPVTSNDGIQDVEDDMILQDADEASGSGHNRTASESTREPFTRVKPVSLFDPSESQQRFMASSQFSVATNVVEDDQPMNNDVPETAPELQEEEIVDAQNLQTIAVSNTHRRPKTRYLQLAPLPIDHIFYGVYPDIDNENFFQASPPKLPRGSIRYVNSRMKHFLGRRAEQETEDAIAFRPYTSRFLKRLQKHSITVLSEDLTLAGVALREHVKTFPDLAPEITMRARRKDTIALLDPKISDHVIWLDPYRNPYGDEWLDDLGRRWDGVQAKILPTYGDSGSEGEDEETIAAVEREQQQGQLKRKERVKLSIDTVQKVIDRTISEYAATLYERVQKSSNKNAYKAWKKATREYGRDYRISKLDRFMQNGLVLRLEKICDAVSELDFYHKKDVEKHTRNSAEITLKDIAACRWEMSVLGGEEPVKPIVPQRVARKSPSSRRAALIKEAEETTETESGESDDGDTDDFIVEDHKMTEAAANEELEEEEESGPANDSQPIAKRRKMSKDRFVEPQNNENESSKLKSPRVKSEFSPLLMLRCDPERKVIDLTDGPPIITTDVNNTIVIVDSDEEVEDAPSTQIHNEIISSRLDRLNSLLRKVDFKENITDQTKQALLVIGTLPVRDLTHDIAIYSRNGALNKITGLDTGVYACLKNIFKAWFKLNAHKYPSGYVSGALPEGKKLEDFVREFKSHLDGSSRSGSNATGAVERSQKSAAPSALASSSSSLRFSSPPPPPPPQRPKHRRPVKIDQEANERRLKKQKQVDLMQRRGKNREKNDQTVESQSSESMKLLNYGHLKKTGDDIFLPSFLGDEIYPHQLEGMRFIWNEVITTENAEPGGALLAHTMGLGKTFQIITLLYMVAKSGQDPNPRISGQVPRRLRRSQTLILAPASLLKNWAAEFEKWLPWDNENEGYRYIGKVHIIDSSQDPATRVETLEEFSNSGGVLLMGYTLFTKLAQDESLKKIITGIPSLVVADEAHYFKNYRAKVNTLIRQIKTPSRIALTGSPLSNNISEYFEIIDWLDRGYLGDRAEFRANFEFPINDGLYVDSCDEEIKEMKVCLRALRKEIAPKVHRCGLEALATKLPKKTEFLITVPLTEIQKVIYTKYVEQVRSNSSSKQIIKGFLDFWYMLGLLLSHPTIFRNTLKMRKEKGLKKILGPEQIDEVNNETQPEEAANGAPSPDNEGDDDMPLAPTMAEMSMLQEDILGEMHDTMLKVCEDHLKRLEGQSQCIDHSFRFRALVDILRYCNRAKEKVLVFSRNLICLDFIGTLLKDANIEFDRLDGSVPTSQRLNLTKRFNDNNDVSVLLVSTRAGALGLNIPSATRVVIFDFGFAPQWEEQAIGRAYRLGQKKPVFVYRFKVGGTFEDDVHNKALFKTQLSFRVVDKKDTLRATKRASIMEWFSDPTECEKVELDEFKGKDPLVLDKILKRGYICDIKLQETFEEHHEEILTAEEEARAKQMLEVAGQRRKSTKFQAQSMLNNDTAKAPIPFHKP